MFTRNCWLLISLLAAIAAGCGTTTASGGTTTGADTVSDTALSDVSGSDTTASGSDTSAGDATEPMDVQCVDSMGCADAVSPDSSGGTDASGDASASTCPPIVKDKALGSHAKPCTGDSECMYGFCQKGGFLTGYETTIGYCTKDCGCSDPAAQCSKDNANGKEFICAFELSQSGGNPKAHTPPHKRCSLHCLTDKDCAAWNPALPHCIGSNDFVSSAGVCGFDPTK